MSAAPDRWTPHLAPGETLVWSASASPALRSADLARSRALYALVGVASLIVALLLAIRFVESLMANMAQPTMLAAVTPLYIAFALAMFALSLWGFRHAAKEGPPALHFALTSRRLIALDKADAVVAEMPGAEIDGVIAGGRRKTPDVYVLRRDDPKEDHVFALEHLDRPLEAKAIIEETFPPAPSDEAQA